MSDAQPGIICNIPRAASRRRRSTSHRGSAAQALARGRPGARPLSADFSERLAFLNTALTSISGLALRRLFAPILRLRYRVRRRERATAARLPAGGRAAAVGAAVQQLGKALVEASRELVGGAAPLPLEAADLAELDGLLRGRAGLRSMGPGGVLSYPAEPPEAAFVDVVLRGAVQVSYYHPDLPPSQLTARRRFLTSREAAFPLVGGNASVAEVMRGGSPAGAFSIAGTDCGPENDAGSAMNLTTTIQRSLGRVSRPCGQPTLQLLRREVLRGPRVLGVAEALGLAPCKHVSCVVVGNPNGPGGGADLSADGTNTMGGEFSSYTDVVRFRLLDVHEALLTLAKRKQAAEQESGFTSTAGQQWTLASFLVAARTKALTTHYPLNELFLRQSWLLQDTPASMIQNLIPCLRPRVYLPGEVIACPHSHRTRGVRQICFLRRGRILVVEASPPPFPSSPASTEATAARPGRFSDAHRLVCGCPEDGRRAREAGRVLEVLEPGALFGELALLFGEPRTHALVADAACDLWCLPRPDFLAATRHDAALRQRHLAKASVLRRRWLDEKRLTPSLAAHLRARSELFRGLGDTALRLVQERLEPVFFSSGAIVASTSERCAGMFFITRGRLSGLDGGAATYGPGDLIGESCLIPHRWPFALAARTILECWWLRREDLLDALERMEILHMLSGRADGQVFAYMKHLFRPPVPEVGTNALGQQCMPIVEAAPGSCGYVAYAKRLAEVQLKALCFLHGGHIKLADILYATIPKERGRSTDTGYLDDDTIAHRYLISKLKHTHAATHDGEAVDVYPISDAVASSIEQHQVNSVRFLKSISASLKRRVPQLSAVIDRCIREREEQSYGSNLLLTKPQNYSKGASSRASSGYTQISSRSRPSNRRNAHYHTNTGFGAFLLQVGANTAPSHRPHPPRRPPSSSNPSPGGLSQPNHPQSSLSAGERLTTPQRSRRNVARVRDQGAGKGASLPPLLQKYLNMLSERDRTIEAEKIKSGWEHNQPQKQLTQGEAYTSTPFESSSIRNPLTQSKVDGSPADAATTIVAAHDNALQPYLARLPPVHLFLMADKPKAVLNMEEALSIGYVLQLPSIDNIQCCVSLVDPDVSICPLAHRARLRTMAMTPNDRFHKHNFYFAAACFEEDVNRLGVSSSENPEANLERDRTLKLLTMLRADALSHLSTETQTKRSPNEEETLQEDEEDLIAADRSSSQLLSEARMTLSSPSPRVVPVPSVSESADKKRESLLHLLGQNPDKMIGVLNKKHQLPPPGAPGIKRELSPSLVQSKAKGGSSAMSSHQTSVLDRLLAAVSTDRVANDPHQLAPGSEPRRDPSVSFSKSATVSAPNISASNMSPSTLVEQNLQETYDPPLHISLKSPNSSFARRFSESNAALLNGIAFKDHFQKREPLHVVDHYGLLNDSNTVSLEADKDSLHMPSHRNSISFGLKGSFCGHSSLDFIHSSLLMHPSGALADTRGPVLSPKGREAAGLDPRDFVMPDVDDAAVIVSSIQRDIEAMNAVAKEQAYERELAQRDAVGDLSQGPSDEVARVWERMRRLCHGSETEAAEPIAVPSILAAEAGPDYLARSYSEVYSMNVEDGTHSNLSKGVQSWHKTMRHGNLVVADTETAGAQENDAAWLVAANIGTKQFGYDAAPLTSPMQNLTHEEYAKLVKGG